MAAVWKTLKISNLKRLSKKSRKMRKTRRRKQRGGYSNVPEGLGGAVTGAMKNSGSDYSSPDDVVATRSLSQQDEEA
jgi:hypothetical protein